MAITNESAAAVSAHLAGDGSDFAFTPFFSTGEISFDAATVFGFEDNQSLVSFQQDYSDQSVVYAHIPGLKIILEGHQVYDAAHVYPVIWCCSGLLRGCAG